MILLLGALGLVLLAAPAIPAQLPHRVPAGEWALLVIAVLAIGAAVLLGALALAAFPVFAWLIGAPGLVDHCRGVLAPLAADPNLLGWIALAFGTVVVCRLVSGAWRALDDARCAQVEPWLGEHVEQDEFELVVLPTTEVVAFGVPSRPPQVVVSSGLVATLRPSETAAVIDHEAAHHRLHHSRHLAVLAGIEKAFAWYPPMSRSADVARAAIETWADAETGVDDVSRTALRRALADMGRPTVRTNERLRRLTLPPRLRHPVARFVSYAPVMALVVLAAVIVTGWFTEAHHAVALGHDCTH